MISRDDPAKTRAGEIPHGWGNGYTPSFRKAIPSIRSSLHRYPSEPERGRPSGLKTAALSVDGCPPMV